MREYENKLANVKKSCDTVRKVAKVLSILMAVCVLFLIFGSVCTFALRERINKSVETEEVGGEVIMHRCSEDGTEFYSNTIDVQRVSIIGTAIVMKMLIHKGMYAESMTVAFLSTAVLCAILIGIYFIIMNIFKMIGNSETPFSMDIMKEIKKAFIIIIGYILISNGLVSAAIAGVLLWCIYCILDYGYALQKEADETL